jgi:flagellar biosynthesis/type III secretory pathway chaperone
MSRDFDNFPTYDPLVKDQVYLSNIWSDFMATFIESLREYLSANGAFIPRLTLEQRNEILDPQEGQMIYVSDANTPTLPRTAELQIWQVVANVGQWTVIV